ncbi:MAG TPA: MmcQ/YjbR family DNA-binding protein [Steroidobacteraceae bacterium]|nr:MmcQ/YjbR family DNA-binding protein [Steroidobacteraceae bacterium]
MTPEGFRALALTLPECAECQHHDHPDFRIGKRVFATLGYPDDSWGMVKLTPPQQARFMTLHPKVFTPVKGAWGAGGSTCVKLSTATQAAVWPALVEAWNNIVPATLKARHPAPPGCK